MKRAKNNFFSKGKNKKASSIEYLKNLKLK
jgi:hypothetical protein